ncbi:hypothetical protein N9571_04555, partial [Yoonia sp.]|nr:hypothetical protein [Yoonia sp.]
TIGSMEDSSSVYDDGDGALTKDADGTTLYRIDSEFGYYVSDFENAEQKILDSDYAEGWAGNKMDGDEIIGLVISDAPTDTFKTPAVFGTWLAGLGGSTVKASTEHYVTMQNVLSDQVMPGFDANNDGDYDDDGDIIPLAADGTPALYPLDNNLFVVGGDYDGVAVRDVITQLEGLADSAGDINGDGVIDIKDVLEPNETEIDKNIAVSTDYSVTLKDDGKLLYRWGNTIKKPNDVRVEATLDLPDDWSAYQEVSNEDDDLRVLYQITAAELVVLHTLTNNPNDQIRPEDYENEAAIGTLPTYEIIEDYDGEIGRTVWATTDPYYAGDGTLYEAGTILKDSKLAAEWAASDMGEIGASDGAAGFTVAWYTTMDREPFQADIDPETPGDSGPRWRLQPDKYGQDLPSVVIPLDPGDVPPPTKDEVKYEVGDDTQTVINLLDWGTEVSPLSISAGWQNKSGDVSENGVNYSNDFDMAVYIKGDIKPATIYSTELLMNYEEIPFIARGEAFVGTTGSDYLVGLGDNTLTGGDGGDLFVVSYGSSNGGALTSSTITDFTVGLDTLGLIGLGVNDTTFDATVYQEVVNGNLVISVDRDGAVIEEGFVQVAVLEGVTEELDIEGDILALTPGAEEDNDDEGPVDPPVEPEFNLVEGTPNADVLVGTAGSDYIVDLGGNDYLYGLEGDDVLDGGAGYDRLFGGAGADEFVLAVGGSRDFVYDFEDGVDVIALDGMSYEDLTFADYRGSSSVQISFGSDSLILRGVSQTEIDQNDFIDFIDPIEPMAMA